MSKQNYTEDSIRSLDWKEHIRLRPGMYIGKIGNGSSPDDGVYVLLKEVIDNCIDEYVMGHGKTIKVSIKNNKVAVRDYGRGIPLGKVIDCVSKINTGAKYDSKVFKKSVGLNGVGTKAVNALSEFFRVQSIRESQTKIIEFNNTINKHINYLVISFDSDWLFPTNENLEIAKILIKNNCKVSFIEINTDKGHDSFLLNEPEFHKAIKGFLNSKLDINDK